MITVTDTAKDMLHGIRAQAGVAEEDVTIRLVPVPEQNTIGFALQHPEEGDQLVEHQGETVAAIDQSVADALDGATLDAVDTPQGRQLAITR